MATVGGLRGARYPMFCGCPAGAACRYVRSLGVKGSVMSTPVAGERDLRTLAGIISDHRADLPAGRAAAVPGIRADSAAIETVRVRPGPLATERDDIAAASVQPVAAG